ncbi:MAG: sensor histidine kinase, partial [Bacteroidota bacterium]
GEICADMIRLRIILNNLVSNAIKFHRFDGYVKPYVKITLVKSDSRYVITVADNGKGIGDSHVKHIFDMFYRASEDSQGSGLGLYILRESVLKLGGTVEVKSHIGDGTTFTVNLPVNPGTSA